MTSNIRGNEINLSGTGLFEGDLGASVLSVNITKYSGTDSYQANTEFSVNASAGLTKGFKGLRPAIMAGYRQVGGNHDASVALGLNKSFGKRVANGKYVPQKY